MWSQNSPTRERRPVLHFAEVDHKIERHLRFILEALTVRNKPASTKAGRVILNESVNGMDVWTTDSARIFAMHIRPMIRAPDAARAAPQCLARKTPRPRFRMTGVQTSTSHQLVTVSSAS